MSGSWREQRRLPRWRRALAAGLKPLRCLAACQTGHEGCSCRSILPGDTNGTLKTTHPLCTAVWRYSTCRKSSEGGSWLREDKSCLRKAQFQLPSWPMSARLAGVQRAGPRSGSGTRAPARGGGVRLGGVQYGERPVPTRYLRTVQIRVDRLSDNLSK